MNFLFDSDCFMLKSFINHFLLPQTSNFVLSTCKYASRDEYLLQFDPSTLIQITHSTSRDQSMPIYVMCMHVMCVRILIVQNV